MNHILKRTLTFISILSVLFMCFYGGYYNGVKSEQSKPLSKNKLEKLDELFGVQRKCREDYGQASRKWDCKVNKNRGKNKNCALSLTVVDEKLKTGKVFVDDLELSAKYEIMGLTQVWKFTDGSKYEIEPNGEARYLKPKEKDLSLSYLSSYTCSAVKT